MRYGILAVFLVAGAVVLFGSLMGLRVAMKQINIAGSSLQPQRRLVMWLSCVAMVTAIGLGTVIGEVSDFTGHAVTSVFAGAAIGVGVALLVSGAGLACVGKLAGVSAPYAFETRLPGFRQRKMNRKR